MGFRPSEAFPSRQPTSTLDEICPSCPLSTRRIQRFRVAMNAGATARTKRRAQHESDKQVPKHLRTLAGPKLRAPKRSSIEHARIRMKALTRDTGRRTTGVDDRDSDARLHVLQSPKRLHTMQTALSLGTKPARRRSDQRNGPGMTFAVMNRTEAQCNRRPCRPRTEQHRSTPQPRELTSVQHRSARHGGWDTPEMGLQGIEPTRDPYPTSTLLHVHAGRSSLGLHPLQGAPLATSMWCKDNISSLGLYYEYQPKPAHITALQSFKELRDGPLSVRRINLPEVLALRHTRLVT